MAIMVNLISRHGKAPSWNEGGALGKYRCDGGSYFTRTFFTEPSLMRMMLMPFSGVGSLRPSME